MPHLDEGTIHAWLDGALSPDESARVESHTAECATCAAAVAEARGLIAASSRILTALDDVPGEVVPSDRAAAARERSFAAAAARARRRPPFRAARYASIAAVVAFVAVTVVVIREEKSPLRVTSDVRATASESVTLQSQPAEPAASPSSPSANETAPSPAPAPALRRQSAEGKGAGVGGVAGALRAAAPEVAAADKATIGATPDEERSLRDRDTQNFATRQEAAQATAAPPPAAPGAPALGKRAVRLRGAEMDSRAQIAQINGRVTDATGAPIPSAQVTVKGTNAGTVTTADGYFQIDSVPAGTQTVEATRIGYAAANKKVETNAGDTVSVNLALRAGAMQLEEVVTAGAAAKSSDRLAEREIAGLTLLTTSDSVENGRQVRRSIYELRPGVTVTLVERRATAQRSAAPSAVSPQVLGQPRRRAANQRPVESNRADAKDAAEQVNTLFWTSSDGTEFTLMGPVPVSELEEVRRRVEQE